MSAGGDLHARNRQTVRVLLAIVGTLAVATLLRGIVW
jgi:hypothetical protein